MTTPQPEPRSFYAEPDDWWVTPCCGIGMYGDIVEHETVCPYCENTFAFDEDDEGDEDDEDSVV